MAFLTGISDRFWNFVSPRKTQQRREKAFRAAAPPTKAQMQSRIKELNAHKLTPDSRIQNWKVRTPGSPESVDVAMLPPSPPTSAARSPSDYEGDTLVAENFGEFGDDDWNANEETLVVDDGKYMDQQGTFDPKAERERREKQGREMRDSGWSEDAVFLFQKLGMRGFEPLMPVDWIDDFDSLPEDLFTANVDKAFIKPMFDSNYHAQLALSNLLDLGGYVRDAVLTKAPKRTPEYHIKRAVNKYNEWAMKDGEVDQVWNQLSLFDVVSCSKFAHSNVAEKKMAAKLSNLRNLWTDALQLRAMEAGGNSQAGAIIPQVPTLYGVVASHTVMAFVSYVPPSEEGGQAGVRLIAMFDFGEEGYDVWNSLAVAIFVIHCRNRLMQLREYLPEAESTVSEDPDI